MSWKRPVGICILAIMAALPVSGAVCTMLCDSAAATRAAAHHGSGKNCDDEQATSPSSGPQVRGASGHDCSNHEAATRVIATTTATRADSVTAPSLLAAVPVHSTTGNLADSDSVFDYRTPPGSTPPTASPLVLRV